MSGNNFITKKNDELIAVLFDDYTCILTIFSIYWSITGAWATTDASDLKYCKFKADPVTQSW